MDGTREWISEQQDWKAEIFFVAVMSFSAGLRFS